MINLSQILHLIGILTDSGVRPKGRVKLGRQVNFEDFQVLEFYADGKCLQPEFVNRVGQPSGRPAPWIWFKLSKAGPSTKGAVTVLGRLAGIPEAEIETAGLKDSRAVTAQLICISARCLSRLLEADLSQCDGFWLQDLQFRDEALHHGSHTGNFFRITVWPQEGHKFTPAELKAVKTGLEKVMRDGYPNFFFMQRFGYRPMSHLVGSLMVAGDYESAFQMLVFWSTSHEEQWARKARAEAKAQRSYREMVRVLAEANASYFAQEIKVLGRLDRGVSHRDALIEPEPSFLIGSWSSWLWNQAIAYYLNAGWRLPEKFPFLKGIPQRYQYDKVRGLYKSVGILLPDWPAHAHQPKAHVVWRPTVARPKGLKARLSSSRCNLEFSLGRNEFATSLLSMVFDLD